MQPSSPGAAVATLPILIVEDNPDTADSLARLLNACGHRCRVVHSGWQVLETALGFRPKVILLDIALPGVTGFEIARELRQHSVLKDIVLIAISGYAREPERAMENGFDHHLVKPVDFAALSELLATIVARQPK